jgi:Domain of unknown function (DUF4390)
MAFIMPFCAKIRDRRLCRTLLAAPGPIALALALAGCSAGPADFGFSIGRVEAKTSAAAVNVVIHQQLVLSSEARDALNHGVPLAIRTELELRAAGSHENITRATREFEIRYLPLSDHYQLTTLQPSSTQTYPRLRHVLAELGAVSFSLHPGQLPPGEYQLRARSLLDKQNMPPPMRLPAWFSAAWKLDSGWQSWPLAGISPE